MRYLTATRLYGGDRMIAEGLRPARERISQTMLDHAVGGAQLTVGIELLALAFVDRFIDSLADGDWPAFLTWVERSCERHAAAAAALRLLACGTAAVAAHVDDTLVDARTLRGEFDRIADDVRQIVEQPRASRVRRPVGTLDEVDATLDRLLSRLTNFDAATAEHSRAVSMWCVRVSRKLALTPAETTLVMRAGLIHDIGKVTTPLHILNAPYRLTDPEMTIMRLHAEAGAAIVRGIRELEHLVPAVRGHHERIDGTGYPDRRAGGDIPLAVRIVSVADSFNAMIGNRPYRPPVAPTMALEQLRLHSGTQFDPRVVAAMVEVVGPHG